MFLWKCRSLKDTDNISTWGGLEPSTFGFMDMSDCYLNDNFCASTALLTKRPSSVCQIWERHDLSKKPISQLRYFTGTGVKKSDRFAKKDKVMWYTAIGLEGSCFLKQEKTIQKGQWHGALMFSLICVWINGWVNNREAGGLRRYRTHYDAMAAFHGC